MTAHAHSHALVPITREFLKQFYQKYPLEPVPVEERDAHHTRVADLASAVTKAGSKVPEHMGMATPTRIDDCFWRNRMVCEEMALSLQQLSAALAPSAPDASAAASRCAADLLHAERSVHAVQEHNTASVKEQLKQFIPQDFRGALLERSRVSAEAKYRKQVDDLVKRGGTIRQRYDLYLQQQWERRQSLVQLGECSGMYKVVIKWVAGIPQVLLDFAKQINAKLGPMEEQRIKYGPDLYGITGLGIALDVCLAAWAESAQAASGAKGGPEAAAAALARAGDVAGVVAPAVAFYVEHMLRVVRFIGDVFQHSPFFVNKADLEGGGGGAAPVAVCVAAGPCSVGSVTSAAAASVTSRGSAATSLAAADAHQHQAQHPHASEQHPHGPSHPAPLHAQHPAGEATAASASPAEPSPSPAAAAAAGAGAATEAAVHVAAANAGGSAATAAAAPGAAAAATAQAPPGPRPPLGRTVTPIPPAHPQQPAPRSAHHAHGHGYAPGGSTRVSATGESVASFASAEEQQGWDAVVEEGEEELEQEREAQQEASSMFACFKSALTSVGAHANGAAAHHVKHHQLHPQQQRRAGGAEGEHEHANGGGGGEQHLTPVAE